MKQLMMWLALVVGTFFTGLANADVEDAMRDHLNSMVNATPPTAYNTSNQAGIYFGSFSQRYQMVGTPPLMSFSPPSIRSGCGGWDIFAGSFSFISAEQIMNLLRSLASAVPAIAFQMALSVLSDELEKKISYYLDKLNKLNLGQLNTCRITNSLLSVAKGDQGMSDVWAMMANDMGFNLNVETNQNDDGSDAADTSGGKTPGASAAASATEPERAQLVLGNIIWRILKDGNAEQWLSIGPSENETLMQWMSVTGTTIGCYKRSESQCSMDPGELGTDDNNENTPPKPDTIPKAHTLSLRELVFAAPEGKPVEILTCTDGTDPMECLKVTSVSKPDFKGMQRVLEDELLGPDRLPGQGLIGRRATLQPLTTRDRRLIALGGPMLRRALEYTDADERLGRDYVTTFSGAVATQITYALLKDVLANARVALAGNHRITGEGAALVILSETERRIEADHMQLKQEFSLDLQWQQKLQEDYQALLVQKK